MEYPIECPECKEIFDFDPVEIDGDLIVECPECGYDGVVEIVWQGRE